MALKSHKLTIFSFLVITFDIIKLLTSSFHGCGAFLRLFPGIPNMSILDLIVMVIISAINDQNGCFSSFMAFMITITIKSNIDMLGIPGKNLKNAAQP